MRIFAVFSTRVLSAYTLAVNGPQHTQQQPQQGVEDLWGLVQGDCGHSGNSTNPNREWMAFGAWAREIMDSLTCGGMLSFSGQPNEDQDRVQRSLPP